MPVSVGQPIKMQDGDLRAYPIAASTIIYQGTAVYVTAAGFADDDTATGVNGFAGIAKETVDNSTGAAGDLFIEVYSCGDFALPFTGMAQTNVGNIVYGEDNYTFGVSISSASVPIGRLVRLISATECIVAISATGDGALPVAALTTITHTSPGTPDYAIANITNTTPFGFSTQDEGNTVLSVIRNLQQRVLDLEARSRV